MILTSATKLDKRNKTILKKFDDDVTSANYDIIVIFPIFGQYRAIQKPDSGHTVCKTYILINSNLKNITKTANRTKKFLSQPHTVALSKGTVFTKKY